LGTDYFTKVLEDDLKALTKPQYVDQIPKALKKKEGEDRSVGHLITQRCEVDEDRLDEIAETLGEFHDLGTC
jgi:ATP-binding cassette subfamily E protein 1